MAKPTLENEVKIWTTCLMYNIKTSNLLIGCVTFFEKTSSSISMHSYFFQGNAEWNSAITFTDPQEPTLVIISAGVCPLRDRRWVIQVEANAAKTAGTAVILSVLGGWAFPGIHYPVVVKSQLIGKDAHAGKGWRQEKQGAREDEIVRYYHWLNGHELGHTPGDSGGQGSLVCCSPWGCKE